MSEVQDRHAAEVKAGERFEFGANWRRFLSELDDERILLAEASLKNFLQMDRLDGRTFLDIGSGSGLFSLCARLLGADVLSFDYDPQSVACTQELRRRYFPDDGNWRVERGSVLDKDYLSNLGQFDIVYSWGVLHHTGQMWRALDNVKALTPVGGTLYIAIYNDQGAPTDRWAAIKARYNSLPRPAALAYALSIVAGEEKRAFEDAAKRKAPGEWIRTWTDYHKLSTRGMSRWHDWIDWIGGYPYERATIEQIAEFYGADGFRLTKLFDCSNGYGCNEFVFRREAEDGVAIRGKISSSRLAALRFGDPVSAPLELTEDGWFATLPPAVSAYIQGGGEAYSMQREKLYGRVRLVNGKAWLAPPSLEKAEATGTGFSVVRGAMRTMDGEIGHSRGNMWEYTVSEFESLADCAQAPQESPLFLFEDDRQLPFPHAFHDDIDRDGAGRFSHWGNSVYFSSRDNSPPPSNGRKYRIFVAVD